MNEKILYCIDCERNEILDLGLSGYSHTKWIEGSRWMSMQALVCRGPFTFSAPPELEENWELNLDATSPDELVEMDATAVELLTEFELM